jgi:hypothetical protein
MSLRPVSETENESRSDVNADADLLSVIGNFGREMNVGILAPEENSAIEQYVRLPGVINVEAQNTIFRRSPL